MREALTGTGGALSGCGPRDSAARLGRRCSAIPASCARQAERALFTWPLVAVVGVADHPANARGGSLPRPTTERANTTAPASVSVAAASAARLTDPRGRKYRAST